MTNTRRTVWQDHRLGCGSRFTMLRTGISKTPWVWCTIIAASCSLQDFSYLKRGPGQSSGEGGEEASGEGGSAGAGAGMSGSVNAGSSSRAGSTNAAKGGAATGGASTAKGGAATGGSACDDAPSSITEITTTFATDLGGLVFSNYGDWNAEATLTQSTTSPSAAPNLCAAGCAVVTVPFAAGVAPWTHTAMPYLANTPLLNLVGAKVVVRIAVDNPKAVPVQFKLFTLTGPPEYAWQELVAPDVATFAVNDGFKAFEFSPVDKPPYCAGRVLNYGIQIVPEAAITASNAGTITFYIQSFSILGPNAPSGAGGASGTAGAAGTTGSSSGTSSGSSANSAGASSNGDGGSSGRAGASASGATAAATGSGAGIAGAMSLAGSAGAQ